jgi:hypothetical protein
MAGFLLYSLFRFAHNGNVFGKVHKTKIGNSLGRVAK